MEARHRRRRVEWLDLRRRQRASGQEIASRSILSMLYKADFLADRFQ